MFDHPANLPPENTVIVCDKGFAGRDFPATLTGRGLTVIRAPPAPTSPTPRPSPTGCANASKRSSGRSRGQLGLDNHGGRVASGLWTRIVQRLLALNAAIWHNWNIGAPVKRSLIA